jgi:putative transposase
MMFSLVLDLAADSIPVAVTCRVLGFSKQAFSQWKANPVSQRDWDDAHLINAAIDIHHDDPEFGYRFITDELVGHGIVASRNRVDRLCTQERIFSNHARKRGLSRKPGPPVHEDLVERQFTRRRSEPAVAGRTSPSTPPARASCICARSRTPAPTGSWATPWPSG